MRDLNGASLAKLGPTRVWARVLAYKYCEGGQLLHQAAPHCTAALPPVEGDNGAVVAREEQRGYGAQGWEEDSVLARPMG